MPWPLRLFEEFDEFYAAGAPVGGVVPVRMQRTSLNANAERAMGHTADEQGFVASFWVAVPSKRDKDGDSYDWFCPHQRYGDCGDGWTVEGTLPGITVSPSIHLPGSYHGYIRNGQVTDDTEGRSYHYGEGAGHG